MTGPTWTPARVLHLADAAEIERVVAAMNQVDALDIPTAALESGALERLVKAVEQIEQKAAKTERSGDPGTAALMDMPEIYMLAHVAFAEVKGT